MASIKKNYMFQVSYEILAILIPLITAPYVTRVLGAVNLGVFSYTQSLASMFLSVAKLGVVNHGSRSIATVQNDRYERSKVFSEIFFVQFTSALFVAIAYVLYVLLFVSDNRIIALIQTLWVAAALVDISWAFMGIENFKITVMRGISIKILSLGLIFLLVRNESDLWVYTIIVAGSTILGNLILWLSKRKYFDNERVTREGVSAHIKPMLVLFIPTIAVTIYTMMDKIMLGSISGDVYVGYYEYSTKLVSIPMGFITSFGAVMLPRMSAIAASGKNNNKQNKTIRKSLIFVLFLSVAFAFGLAAISDVLIPLYYGAEFLPCIFLLKIVAIKLPAMAWANVIRTQILIPEHKDNQYIVSLFIGAGVNLVLNYFFISKYQAVGAAIATVIAEITVCIVQTLFVNRKCVLIWPAIYGFGFTIIGAIMYCAVQKVGSCLALSSIVLLVLELFVGVITYCIMGGLFISFFVVRTSPIKLLLKCYKQLR